MAALPLPCEQALSVFSLSYGKCRGFVDSMLHCLDSNSEAIFNSRATPCTYIIHNFGCFLNFTILC